MATRSGRTEKGGMGAVEKGKVHMYPLRKAVDGRHMRCKEESWKEGNSPCT